MKNVAIIPNVNKDKDLSVTDSVISRLLNLGLKPYLPESLGHRVSGCESFTEFPPCCDLCIVVGGDGSVLDASVAAIDAGVPLLGINLGKVGYLSEVDPSQLGVLDCLVSGEYEIVEKMLLSSTVSDGDGLHTLKRLAVNDVVVSHSGHLGIAEVAVQDSVGNSLKYRADGVVVSTPQGSTAYSLSSGGPIVAHNVDALIVTPVSPHSFFNRSVIFSSTDKITLTNLGADDLNISVDGRLCAVMAKGEFCSVERAQKTVKMISFSKNSMFKNLFRKMKILEDID